MLGWLQFLLLGSLAAAPIRSLADTIHVPGDQPTIQAGLNAANPGDVVLVAPGTYLEHDIQLAPGVTLQGESGASATVIDAERLGHGLIGANGAIVRDLTVRNSGGTEHHGLFCVQSAVEVADCIFADHQHWAMVFAATEVNVHGCEIRPIPQSAGLGIMCENSPGELINNSIDMEIGLWALNVGFAGVATRDQLVVEGNVIRGGVKFGVHLPVTVECNRNLLSLDSGRMEVYGTVGTTRIQGNTILNGEGIYLQEANAQIESNIIAFHDTGITWDGLGSVTVDCNDLWQNGIDYVGVVPGPADFSADPLLCAPDLGDYRLMETSPCLPGHHPGGFDCGLIGAFDAGCAATPVRYSTWGGIKALYR